MSNAEQHPDDLLPWYVNATLDPQERQHVEAHLQGCERCRRELEFLRAVRETARQPGEAPPGELAWQRLKRDMRRERRPAAKRPWWVPALATAAALVIVVQSVLLFHYSSEELYEPAGSRAEGTIVQVKFNPDATERSIRRTLQDADAQIITGPSAAGVYRIRLGGEDPQDVVQTRIDSLEANTDVIDYIQRD